MTIWRDSILTQENQERLSRLVNNERNWFGANVIVVRTTFEGIIETEELPAALAVHSLESIWEENGTVYRSARIIWNDVCSRDWDMSK